MRVNPTIIHRVVAGNLVVQRAVRVAIHQLGADGADGLPTIHAGGGGRGGGVIVASGVHRYYDTTKWEISKPFAAISMLVAYGG